MDKAKQRVTEIDQLIQKSYEDMSKGLLSEERFATLSISLENEQKQLKAAISEMEAGLDATVDKAADLQRFIEKIMVSKPEKIDGKRHQRVDIYYSTIGFWSAPDPETLEQEYLAYYNSMQKRRKKTA